MDGLEAVEMRFCKVFEIFNKSRIDPEFFGKELKQIEGLITKKHFKYLSEIAFVTDGEHGTVQTSNSGFAKYFGARNVLNGILDEDSGEFISKENHDRLKKSKLLPTDVLLSCVGANIGYAAIVPSSVGQANIVRNVALLRSVSQEVLNEYLLAYFINKYGKRLFIKMGTGNAQPLVSLDYIKNIPVFIPSLSFQRKITAIINASIGIKNHSKLVFKEAEDFLLNELDLHNWQPTQVNTAVKSFKNSFLQSGRLDAEYYQPKYNELLTKIQKAEYYELQQLVKIKKSIEPGSAAYLEEGIPFIRVANLSKYGLTEPDIHLSINEVEDIETLFPKKDTILLTKDGSVGIAYKVEKDTKAITSGAILHLTVKNNKIIPDYLTLVLNSVLTQLQAERDAGGSIIQHWRMIEIEKVLIPVIEIEKQEEIAQLIQQSFQLKQQSQQLLESAKQAVEIAIEQGEEKAMEWINNIIKG